MTYKLYDPTLEKISGAVVCVQDNNETEYADIQELLSLDFDRNYVVKEIFSRGDKTVVSLGKSDIIPNDVSA